MVSDTGVISVRHVGKTFARSKQRDQLEVLRDINLEIAPGEFISLIGASGCGKTTLLRMMSGLLPCSDGTILIHGESVVGVPRGIGFVFQDPALLPWRTIAQNVAFGLTGQSLSRDEINTRVNKQLALTDLQAFADYLPQQVSGGMQQRGGLARALVGAPEVLLMDEPLSALDAFTRKRLQEEVSGIIDASGATTIMVTHDVDEAIFMSDRVIVLAASPGRICGDFHIPMDRPRRLASMLNDERVAHLRDSILGLVMDEAKALFSQPIAAS